MSAKLVFACDHEGCDRTYTIDTGLGETHECEEEGCGGINLPMQLVPIVNYMTDKVHGLGWEFALTTESATNSRGQALAPLLLFHKCFCPEHVDDFKADPDFDKFEHPGPDGKVRLGNRAERRAAARRTH